MIRIKKKAGKRKFLHRGFGREKKRGHVDWGLG